ncbi:transferase hexapeptide repeat containing protein [Shewanella halifaxensis HAW-EB4]|uniref:Transferase hexapeptide repeat containing protein n=1 Tax=Shewanella halifaxensis (strain HAW-EB4) TaxID=458817 RepID=B0TT05_SHEHH|nr:CatB-related O-acetyltransferase [Shewanella halifaxensis]ABZ76566.1 transferase hexapeptide repeat containing protein [Shewanella halifaxensis HAW-EB4]
MNTFTSWLESKKLKEQIVNPNIQVGEYSYYSGFYHGKSFEDQAVRYLLGDDSTIDVWEAGVFGEVDKLIIGKFCAIASGACFMLAGNQGHRLDWISTYPFSAEEFGDGVKSGFERAGDTVIGNDVWIGSEAMIMPGVTIGDGAVIGARAVISKDVAPYSVVVGSNKLVKQRFPSESVEKLQQIKWWDWPLEKLQVAMPILCSGDIDALHQYYLEQMK